VCAISEYPDQPVVRNKIMNQKANTADPDQRAWMCWLIRTYTVCPENKGVYMEE
jgi:hypothetical protein